MKNEHPRRSVGKNVEYVIDYACEDGCVKVENVKLAKTRLPVGCSQASAHKSTLRLLIYCAGQVRGSLLIVCGAPIVRGPSLKSRLRREWVPFWRHFVLTLRMARVGLKEQIFLGSYSTEKKSWQSGQNDRVFAGFQQETKIWATKTAQSVGPLLSACVPARFCLGAPTTSAVDVNSRFLFFNFQHFSSSGLASSIFIFAPIL